MRAATCAILAISGAALADEPPIPYPHPVITEILFDTPSEVLGGDANLDGAWTSLGEEFVELVNPHDRAIDIGGYSISDTHPDARYTLGFVIPEGARLEPGERLVVFNGFRQTVEMPGPYGDRRTLATAPNENFGGAYVYSAKNITSTRAFTDTGDVCVLRDPDGAVIELIEWGDPRGPLPENALRRQRLEGDVAFSYQRLGPWNAMLPHIDIDGRRFSPGEIPTEITGAPFTDNDVEAPIGPTPPENDD